MSVPITPMSIIPGIPDQLWSCPAVDQNKGIGKVQGSFEWTSPLFHIEHIQWYHGQFHVLKDYSLQIFTVCITDNMLPPFDDIHISRGGRVLSVTCIEGSSTYITLIKIKFVGLSVEHRSKYKYLSRMWSSNIKGHIKFVMYLLKMVNKSS